jgi:hypothetical protein
VKVKSIRQAIPTYIQVSVAWEVMAHFETLNEKSVTNTWCIFLDENILGI